MHIKDIDLNLLRLFVIEPALPLRDFTVSLHWSRRFESDPGNQWLQSVIVRLFRE